jgi:hypothetical protein
MIVYHGSYAEIQKIDLSKARPNKDFGQGFYVTAIEKHAHQMAAKQGKLHNCAGVVTKFEFDYDGAFQDSASNDLKTKKFDGYTSEWLNFVVKNRRSNSTRNNNGGSYDIIEGPVADDVVAETIDKYVAGMWPEEDYLRMLTHHEETHQICFRTEKSLDTIKRIDLKPRFNIEDIGKAIIKQLVTKDKILEVAARDLYYESDTFENLSDENTKLYQKPWQEVYNILMDEIGRKQAANFSMKQFVVNGHVYYGSDLSADEVYRQEELQKERRQGPDTPESGGGGDFGL